MEGAEAGRRERWRNEGEMRGNKNSRFKKINDESYYMIIVLYIYIVIAITIQVHMSMHFEYTKI